MPESGTYGSARGAVGNHRSYRNRRASLEKLDAQDDPTVVSGKSVTTGWMSEVVPPVAAPG
jgi:hypothetical protein